MSVSLHRLKKAKRTWPLFFFAMCLAGCSTTVDYQKPDMHLPDKFKESSGEWAPATPADQLNRGNWWRGFSNLKIDELIERGTRENFQIAAAAARLNAARSLLNVAESAQVPLVGVNGAVTNNRQSETRPLRGATQPDYYPNNSLGVSVSYELDLWGRLRGGVESASALSQASEADLETIRLLIQADIVNLYFFICGLDSQIQVSQVALASYTSQAKIINSRRIQGTVAPADYYRVQNLVENERIKIKTLETRRAQYEHALAVLLGVPPSSFQLEAGNVFQVPVPRMPEAVPSKMLQRRPDVASIERRVASTNAEIGIAKTAFFPNIMLSVQGGYQNSSSSQLINSPNVFWMMGPQLLGTLFDGGRRSALVRQAEARNQEAVALYKTTVLNAMREVEDMLVDLNNRENSLAYMERNLDFSNKTYKIATARYNEGMSSYLEVVDAALQKSLLESQLIDHRTQMLVGRTTLIKAMGGFWD